MSRPGNVPDLMIGLVRRMAVAGVNVDEAKTSLPVAAGCRSPARTFPPVGRSSGPIDEDPFSKLLNSKCLYLTMRSADPPIPKLIPC